MGSKKSVVCFLYLLMIACMQGSILMKSCWLVLRRRYERMPHCKFFFQISHVYERHAAGVKAEEEHVPCKFQCFLMFQVKGFYPADGFDGDGTLHGFSYPCIDVFERMALFGQLLFYRPVICCSEDAHVERDSVWCQSFCFQVGFVCLQQVGVDFL